MQPGKKTQKTGTSYDTLVYWELTTFKYVYFNCICIFAGKTPHLYRHDLLMLHSKQTNRLSLPLKTKIPEKLVPR